MPCITVLPLIAHSSEDHADQWHSQTSAACLCALAGLVPGAQDAGGGVVCLGVVALVHNLQGKQYMALTALISQALCGVLDGSFQPAAG